MNFFTLVPSYMQNVVRFPNPLQRTPPHLQNKLMRINAFTLSYCDGYTFQHSQQLKNFIQQYESEDAQMRSKFKLKRKQPKNSGKILSLKKQTIRAIYRMPQKKNSFKKKTPPVISGVSASPTLSFKKLNLENIPKNEDSS